MSSKRYLCVHGHFYQPPRENPWLEAVEVQDSAAPFHDWNDRITRECYAPNAAARITTWDSQILDIRNNYRKISFNFGPTLLQWMENNSPETYAEILEADRYSVAHRNGHGNALAQSFNHTILPLATAKEKQIQVLWGLEDFRYRFNRDPEGMWLPETAVDLETLDCLAANGVKFTVLAPRQGRRFRVLNETRGWIDCDGGRIDPTRPYVCTLPSGRSITLFFYDGPISQAVAFEGLLNDGNHFANRLMQGFSDQRPWNQLLSIATDGESYGHHHRYGEMALSYALHVIEREGWATLTNYAEFAAMSTPECEVQIWEKSSWSCVHGIERWRNDCGCHSGSNIDWHQKWRKPLREAFRLLADRAFDVYTQEAREVFHDDDIAIFDYVHVMLDRRPERIDRFLKSNLLPEKMRIDQRIPLQLLEIMRNAQLLFTSCAWFFDEVSGLETVQNLKYAARLIQLLRHYDSTIERDFLALLVKIPSNIPQYRTCSEVYRRFVQPEIVDLQRVIAHHSICTIENEDDGVHQVFCYDIEVRDSITTKLGQTMLKICNISARSRVDSERIDATTVVLHHGGSDFRCSITGAMPPVKYDTMSDRIFETLTHGSLTSLIRIIDEYFGHAYYSLEDAFSEGKRELLQRLTYHSFRRFDDSITLIFEENRKFMDYLLDVGAPLPQGFLSAADFVLKTKLVHELERFLGNGHDATNMIEVAEDIHRFRVHVGDDFLPRKFETALRKVFRELALKPTVQLCTVALSLLEVIDILRMKVDQREMESITFALVHRRPLPAFLLRHGPHIPEDTGTVIHALEGLAKKLRVSLEPTARSLGQSSPVHITLGGSSETMKRMKSAT